MRKWQSYYDVLYFPLVLLFVASVIKGISGLILNPNFQVMFHISNHWVILLAEMFRYIGYFLMNFFPFLLLIKILSKRYEDSVPVFIGVVSYILINISTMFLAKSNLPAAAYSSELGIIVNAANMTLEGTGYRYPLSLGMISVLVSITLTRYFYTSSRKRGSMGLFAFVNRDAYALITTGIASLLLGYGISSVWPYVIKLVEWLFRFISEDITNPINLFIYGTMERVLAVLDLDSVLHSEFWFGELGGSWISQGVVYYGDISVWTAQLAEGVYGTGFGRLLTPYYIINIFVAPAIILSTFTTFTDKLEKGRYAIFMILAILLSVVCGNILPIEIYMLIMTPLFYMVHVFLIGVLYAVLQAMSIQFGYSYSGSVAMATPGSIFDLIFNIRNANLLPILRNIAIVGIIFAVIYYVAIQLYYRRWCLDLLDIGMKEEYIDNFISAVGGLDNIKKIYSTPTKIILQPEDNSLLNFKLMQKQGVYKVVETRTTYDLSYGAISFLVVKEVEKRLGQS